jgi:starvation-inducible outer membrane lipoprotein
LLSKVKFLLLGLILMIFALILTGCASIPIPSKLPLPNDIPILGLFL